jgi:2-oxoglutarate dehydrogenase E2 component (dihydrolipoamide succinyltransferase)
MTDVPIPQIGESITSVFIAKWLKEAGQTVTAGEPILEIDSDKASMELPSPVSGRLTETLGEEGDEILIGAIVARIEEGEVAEAAAPAVVDVAPSGDDVRAGPAARREAGERSVDLTSVEGSGRRGRVTAADVRAVATQSFTAPPGSVAAVPEVGSELEERVPMSPLRRTIARRLVQAQATAAMLTTFNEVDMSHIMALRKRYQDQFVKKYGHKLGFMSFFVKASIEALKAFPALNAQIDGTDIIYKNYFHIGIAVSSPRGLVVPVLRDADQRSFSGVEQGIMALGAKARDGKLSLADFQGGTFTISNGGVFGSMMSTPILNAPQSGILGMHNILQRPVAVDGEVVIRPMMYLALTYDHRVVDGREAVSFLVRIKECVENPERMLLEV